MNGLEIKELNVERCFQPTESSFLPAVIVSITPSMASEVMALFSDKIPLQKYGLVHLKRIKRADSGSITEGKKVVNVLVCPLYCATELPAEIMAICNKYPTFVSYVSRHEPRSVQDFQRLSQQWPVNYYPSQLAREQQQGLSKNEIYHASKCLKALLADETSMMEMCGVRKSAVIVNPADNQIVFAASAVVHWLKEKNNIDVVNHPLYNPAMICIEGVAAIVRGEANIGMNLIFCVLWYILMNSCV